MKPKSQNPITYWLGEIMLTKTPASEIPEEKWNTFNPFMINRYLSSEPSYIDLVNYVQKIPQDNKQQIYSIYRQMIPKKKVFLKVVSKKSKKPSNDLTKHIAKYFECGLGEAEEYIDILRNHGVTRILYDMGITDEKEIKNLLK